MSREAGCRSEVNVSFDAPRRAGSRDMLHSARRLGLARDFGRALIRKIT